ncbi:MAG: Zn-ribbon domain-containing OB-fold protein [Candidatus Thorarchaeota archaeon]
MNKFRGDKDSTLVNRKVVRPPNTKEVGFQFVDYSYSKDNELFVQHLHYDQLYTIRYGDLSPYAKGLIEGKLMGTRCPKCGDKFFPARVHCWNLDCKTEPTEWIELKPEGRVHTYTQAGWAAKSVLKKLPFILAYVVVDNCKTAIANDLKGIKPWDAEFDMPVIVKFKPKEERVGSITDFWFEPAPGWKPSPMNAEKERIKELCEPVYKWVKTLK